MSIVIGKYIQKQDEVMYNFSFQYAASFEQLLVPAGEYDIVMYEGRGYGAINYSGTVISGNVGGKPGDKTHYAAHIYDYEVARKILEGDDRYSLMPDYTAVWHTFISPYDGKELTIPHLADKDGNLIDRL